MADQTNTTHADWQDQKARFSEIKRLATELPLAQPIKSDNEADLFAQELLDSEFWLSLLGVDSFSSAAELLNKCTANWHSLSSLPPTYTDEFPGRTSLPVLARTDSGELIIAYVYLCGDASCTRCPSWSLARRTKRLPSHGPNSLTGWLGLGDIITMKKHTN